MKKAKSTSDDLRPEYKRSDFKRLERGKYYKRVKATSSVVVLEPEPVRTPKNRTKRLWRKP
jgi:hypothetical protein